MYFKLTIKKRLWMYFILVVGEKSMFYVIHSSLNVMLFRSFRTTVLWQTLLSIASFTG